MKSLFYEHVDVLMHILMPICTGVNEISGIYLHINTQKQGDKNNKEPRRDGLELLWPVILVIYSQYASKTIDFSHVIYVYKDF